jgi:epoxyqueuosine reductase
MTENTASDWDALAAEIDCRGYRCVAVQAASLCKLKAEIDDFRSKESLNDFQRHIAERHYEWEPEGAPFPFRSVIIVATPTPAFAEVVLSFHGERIPVKCLARGFPDKPDGTEDAEKVIVNFLAARGYHVKAAPRLAMKRLAARSGLARYGRNNICYVEGMGSFLALSAFYSDMPREETPWRDLAPMDACASCSACEKSCPTGAIRRGRFLIDTARCLSFYNEGAGDFPEWLPEAVHHCAYDCLRCQSACPQNRAYSGNSIGPIEFSESETEDLLSGKGIERFKPESKQAAAMAGLGAWPQALPRNLRILIDRHLRAKRGGAA